MCVRAPPAVLPCSGEPPAGVTGELLVGNGLVSLILNATSDVTSNLFATLQLRRLSAHTAANKIHLFWGTCVSFWMVGHPYRASSAQKSDTIPTSTE